MTHGRQKSILQIFTVHIIRLTFKVPNAVNCKIAIKYVEIGSKLVVYIKLVEIGSKSFSFIKYVEIGSNFVAFIF